MKRLNYDYSLMMAENIGINGISQKSLQKIQTRLDRAHQAAHSLLASGEQGFVRNLSDKSHEQELLSLARSKRKIFKELLVIGIGGSDLGARALQGALGKESQYKVHFAGDTVDPAVLKKIFSQINWKQCVLNPVSKSGNTIETMAVFFAARRELMKHVGKEHASQVLVTTEENNGPLYEMAIKEGYQVLPHPKTIGGRWAILSNVGLFSAAFTGIDITSLRKGALDFYRTAKKDAGNQAILFAALHALGAGQNQKIAVLVPYESRLESLGFWYRQLFGESLAKAKNKKGKTVHTGFTPVVAVGPRDQHSQIQLYNEGPADKLVTFITAESTDTLNVPKIGGALSFLSGKSFHELLRIEQEATALSLASHKRPNGVIHLPDLTPYTIGQLIMFFELACVYLAELFEINAFDQPGVEEGKRQMDRMLRE